jgi:dihydroorotate dehydrogenase (NAD+) catalytic subunit
MDLTSRIGSLTLANPLIAASGCFGYGLEYERVVDLSLLGAVAVKGLFLTEREGHPPPRIVETPAGMLNAIGLQGIGVRRFVRERLPELRARRAVVIVNVCGVTLDEYVEVVRILSDAEGVAAIELNISCPNVSGGVDYGTDPQLCQRLVAACRDATQIPIIAKLTPNVTSIPRLAEAAAAGGADAISLINTCLGMAIDWRKRRPLLGGIMGGLSGPAIKPIALRCVYQAARAVDTPIIGIGGIATIDDVMEFLVAGATAVQLGTVNFYNPRASMEVLDALPGALATAGVTCVADLVGTLVTDKTLQTRHGDKETGRQGEIEAKRL